MHNSTNTLITQTVSEASVNKMITQTRHNLTYAHSTSVYLYTHVCIHMCILYIQPERKAKLFVWKEISNKIKKQTNKPKTTAGELCLSETVKAPCSCVRWGTWSGRSRCGTGRPRWWRSGPPAWTWRSASRTLRTERPLAASTHTQRQRAGARGSKVTPPPPPPPER